MAYNRDIGVNDKVFHDTDRLLRYTVYAGDPTAAQIAANQAVPLDVSGWALSWVLRRKVDSADPPLIEKSVGSGISIIGSFNVDPLVNAQRVVVTLEDTDTYDPAASPVVNVKAGSYVYALKRTDDGSEGILAYGKFTLQRAAARE